MPKKLLGHFVSAKSTIIIIASLLMFIIAGFYFSSGMKLFKSFYFIILLTFLGLSLLICTGQRIVKLKNYSSPFQFNFRWGSIAFHIGLLIILIGFAISALFGMRGKVIIPEGVAAKFPADLEIVEQGPFHEYKNYQVGLNKMELVRDGSVVGQVRGDLDFIRNAAVERLAVEINHPAKYQGYYWRSQEWGYTLKILIKEKEAVVLDDYVNIATHADGLYYDKFTLTKQTDMRLQFFPYMRTKGVPDTTEIFPDNPGLKVEFIDAHNKGKTGEGFISLGQEAIIGNYSVLFSELDFWEQFDVSSDPGEWLIFFGGAASIIGLALRIMGRRK